MKLCSRQSFLLAQNIDCYCNCIYSTEQLDETENNSLQKENNGELKEKSSSSKLKEECTYLYIKLDVHVYACVCVLQAVLFIAID